MRFIKEFKINKTISKDFAQSFAVDKDGLYLLEISARGKNWRQNWGRLFDDDDLAVSLDDRDLSGVEGRRAFEKPKAGWNGNQLKNLNQINVFILRLQAGKHELVFKPDQQPKLEFLRIYEISNPSKVEFVPQSSYKQAEDGNRRPWYTFALIGLSLEALTITAKASSGRQHTLFQSDDDDLQVSISGKRQRNDTPRSHPYWFWCGRVLKGESRTFEKELNLPSGTHYIELLADRTPTFEKVTFKFTGVLPVGKVKLYEDVTTFDQVHLWKDASAESEVLAELFDGDEVEILEERVVGTYMAAKSYIWHKVSYKGQTGYILSTFVELPGQDRYTVIQKIKRKARELGVDENIALALSGCESQYKPFATSKPYDPDDDEIARGVFQLTDLLIKDLNNKEKPFYSPVSDPFIVEQNVPAGIRYFKWLYQERYRNDKDRLRKAVAAYNTGPYAVPVEEDLNLNLYEAQTRRLVECVPKNVKRRNWRHILLSSLIFLFSFTVGSVYYYLDWIDFFEPTLSVEEVLMAETRPHPSATWYEETDQVFFFNTQGKLVKRIPAERLGLERIFNTPPDIQKWNSVHISKEVLEVPKNTFYFLAATSYSCGANNCTWVLYRFDIGKDLLEVIEEGIFGLGVDLYLSPEGKKIAIVRTAHAMVCDNRSYLDLLDIAKKNRLGVDKFTDPELEVTSINELSWLSEEKMELLTTHGGGCDPSKLTIRRKRFFYDLETGEAQSELLEEREVRG